MKQHNLSAYLRAPLSRHSISLLRSGRPSRPVCQSPRDLDLESRHMLDVRIEAARLVARLTTRQDQILNLIADGQPTKIIAAYLGISQRTVEKHRAMIAQKTGAKSLAAVIHTALCARCDLNKINLDARTALALGEHNSLLLDVSDAPQTLAQQQVKRLSGPSGNGAVHHGTVENGNASRDSAGNGDCATHDNEVMRVSMDEAQHRVSNMVANIQSICRQTMRQSGTKEEFEAKFSARLTAFCSSFSLLLANQWRDIDIHDLLRSQLTTFGSTLESQIYISGPAVKLRPNAARNIGMAIHELATNAVKHGALSVPEGKVAITWRHQVDPNAECFNLSWMERDGPVVTAPTRQGFGRKLVERMIPVALNGTSTYAFAPTGVCWTLNVPIADAIIPPSLSNGANL